jgi:putative transposase
LGKLCTLFGVTRQTYYEAEIKERKTSIAHIIVLCIVKELRNEIPFIGTRKLLFLLPPHLEAHGIKMGRDQLFDILRFYGLMIRRRKRMVKTTDSHHLVKKIPEPYSRAGYYIT